MNPTHSTINITKTELTIIEKLSKARETYVLNFCVRLSETTTKIWIQKVYMTIEILEDSKVPLFWHN